MARCQTLFAAAAIAALLACSAVSAQVTASSGGNNSTITTPGSSAASTGGTTTAAGLTGGGSASGSSSGSGSGSSTTAASVAALAAGSVLPRFSVAPAFDVVKPVITPVAPVAFTGVIVQEVVKFSDEFCTPASFKLPVAHAANYTGPGMSITFTTGTCTIPLSTDGSASDPAVSVDDTSAASGGSASAGGNGVNATLGDTGASAGSDGTTAGASRRLQGASASSGGNGNNRQATASLTSGTPASNTTKPAAGNLIQCTEPSLTIVKTPAIYTSAYTSAAEWKGKECKVDKAVGAPTSEVLYVFDEANPINPLSLASLIQGKLATILQDGYQDLIKQITSSITIVQAAGGVPGLVGTANPAAGSAAASAGAAGNDTTTTTTVAAGR